MKSITLLFMLVFASLIAQSRTPILDLAAIDPSVDPCENFYKYACGNWQKNTALPVHKSVIYRQSEELEEQSWIELRSLIEQSSLGTPLRRFYEACMRPAKSFPPGLRQLIRRLQSIRSTEELAFMTGQLHAYNISAFFEFTTWQDLDKPEKTIVYLTQGGLPLPEKDYYLKQDKAARDLRKTYQAHIAEVLRLAELQVYLPSLKTASDILAIEKSLAEKALPLEDQWTPVLIKNKVSLNFLKRQYQSWDWEHYFSGLGLAKSPNTFNLNEPKLFARLNTLIKYEGLEDLKMYLIWQVLHEASPWLNGAFEQSHFEFWEKELNGVESPQPRWQKCVQHTGESLRDLLGKTYVENLPDALTTKAAINKIIDQALILFSDSLSSIPWIDTETSVGAKLKLDHFGRKVGFPDQWESYLGLKVSEADRVSNLFNLASYERRKEFARIDRNSINKDWSMAPWEINAYYDPSLNEFAFPFGILRPPAFDLSASDAINMGTFGALVGHELLHAFDADGSQYDYLGRALDWWSESSRKQFDERSQCLVSQANGYELLPGLFVNGERTITENVADQGGLKMAYALYLKRKSEGAESPNLGELNGDQQFFVAFAQSWCVKRTEESLRTMIKADLHPPEEFRVNASMWNRPEFAATFSCQQARDRMAPANRCDIW